MVKSIQQLREQRKEKAVAARKTYDETTNWDDKTNESYNEIIAAIDVLDAQIKRHDDLMEREAKNLERVEDRANVGGISIDEATNNLNTEKEIFNSFLRGGTDNFTAEQREHISAIQNAMSTGVATEGGYLAPNDFAATLLKELKEFGGVREVANIITTSSGNTIDWPTVDATGQIGEIVAENTVVGNGEVVFGTKQLGAYKYSSKDIAIPIELLADSEVDLEAYIRELLVERIARITNQHFTIGTGTAQPNGVVTASGVGTTGTIGQTTSVTYDDLVDLEHSIDPAYRKSDKVRFMFNDSTLKALKKLKDSQGRPLWLPGISSSDPSEILGYKYVINQDVAVMAADAKSILFGDFSKYMIRDVLQVALLRMTDSAFSRKGQVGFLAFSRHDGDLIDSSNSAIKHYANSAT